MHTGKQNVPQLLDSTEAAEYLGLRPATLDVWRCTGRYELPFVRVGRRIRYKKSDLDLWLTRRTVGGEAA